MLEIYRDKRLLQFDVTEQVAVGETLVCYNTDTDVDAYCVRGENDKYNQENWCIYEVDNKSRIVRKYDGYHDIDRYLRIRYTEILDVETTKNLVKELDDTVQCYSRYTDFWFHYNTSIKRTQDW